MVEKTVWKIVLVFSAVLMTGIILDILYWILTCPSDVFYLF